MNPLNMDPANQVLLILATVALVVERIVTFREWIARRSKERRGEVATIRADTSAVNAEQLRTASRARWTPLSRPEKGLS